MADDYVTVSWFEHDCEWVSKYCYEHHEVHARVPLDVLHEYTTGATSSDAGGDS